MKYKFLWALCVLFALSGLSACQPKKTDLPFETIEQRDASGTGQVYKDKSPSLIVVAEAERTILLNDLVTPTAQEQLHNLNYEVYFVIAVFQGRKPSTGYSVKIEQIVRKGNKVSVYAQFLEPKPGEAKADEETSPYHLAQVQKAEKWGQEVTFELIVEGKVVFSLSQYLP